VVPRDRIELSTHGFSVRLGARRTDRRRSSPCVPPRFTPQAGPLRRAEHVRDGRWARNGTAWSV